jgi:hypothetical protein
MQRIVVLLPKEFKGRLFQNQNVWKKIGVTYTSPDLEDEILCIFNWGEAMVPRKDILFIGPPLAEIRDDQLHEIDVFRNFIELNQSFVLEVILDLFDGILVRNPDNLRRISA